MECAPEPCHYSLSRCGGGHSNPMNMATQTSSSAVNTAKVGGRRILRFETIDQALAEADRLAEAERAGRLQRLGNWTLGQAFGHVAVWGEYAYTGAPLKVPFFIKWLV